MGMMWFILIIIFMGILFACRLYAYENSGFRKMTGSSLYEIWTNQHVKNTYKLVQSLKSLKGEYKLILNADLPAKETNRHLDAIVIHESGIYFLNIQVMDGWIYGREQDGQWAQAVYKKDKLFPFDNPINELKKELFDLKDQIANLNKDVFHTMVLFADSCSLKKVIINSDNVYVMKVEELKDFWPNRTDKKLSANDINRIYQTLSQLIGNQKASPQPNMTQAVQD